MSPNKIFHIFDDVDYSGKFMVNPQRHCSIKQMVFYAKYKFILPYIISNPSKNWNWNHVQYAFYCYIKNQYAYKQIIETRCIEFLCKYHEKITIWCEFTQYLSADFIQKHPNKGWYWHCISNKIINNFDINFLIQHKLFYLVYKHEDFSLDIVENNIEKEWAWSPLTSYASWKFINDHLDDQRWKWNIGYILNRKPITLKFMKENNTQIVFDFRDLSHNPHMTMDIVEYFIDENWNYLSLIKNGVVGVDFFVKHPEKVNDSVLRYLMEYSSIESMKQCFPEVVNNNYYEVEISKNNNITMKEIQNYADDINIFIMMNFNTFKGLEKRIKNRTQSFYILQQSLLSSEIVRHICTTFV